MIILQQQQLLETVRAKSQAVLEVGDCTASEKGLTLQNLPSLLQGKPGRVSVAICGADLPEALSSVEGSLKEAGRPHLVVYAGQPEQVIYLLFLCLRKLSRRSSIIVLLIQS